jgi:hypothetical protein
MRYAPGGKLVHRAPVGSSRSKYLRRLVRVLITGAGPGSAPARPPVRFNAKPASFGGTRPCAGGRFSEGRSPIRSCRNTAMRTFGWAQMCLTPSLCCYPLEALYEAAAPISPLAALRWTRNLPDLSLLISNFAAMAGLLVRFDHLAGVAPQ